MKLIYKDALVVAIDASQGFRLRAKNYEITYKGIVLPHIIIADFVCLG